MCTILQLESFFFNLTETMRKVHYKLLTCVKLFSQKTNILEQCWLSLIIKRTTMPFNISEFHITVVKCTAHFCLYIATSSKGPHIEYERKLLAFLPSDFHQLLHISSHVFYVTSNNRYIQPTFLPYRLWPYSIYSPLRPCVLGSTTFAIDAPAFFSFKQPMTNRVASSFFYNTTSGIKH